MTNSDFWGDLRKHGTAYETRDVVARYRQQGKKFLLMTQKSDFARAFARELTLRPEEWRMVYRNDSLRGVHFPERVIVAVAGFSQTALWQKEFDFKGLALAIAEGAILIYPNGNPVDLVSNRHHPDHGTTRQRHQSLRANTTPRSTSEVFWEAFWEDPPVDVKTLLDWLDWCHVTPPPSNATLTVEGGRLVYRIGGRFIRDYDLPKVLRDKLPKGTCPTCRHYDGKTYGGNLLVCGMHPYGPQVEGDCDDWQGVDR